MKLYALLLISLSASTYTMDTNSCQACTVVTFTEQELQNNFYKAEINGSSAQVIIGYLINTYKQWPVFTVEEAVDVWTKNYKKRYTAKPEQKKYQYFTDEKKLLGVIFAQKPHVLTYLKKESN